MAYSSRHHAGFPPPATGDFVAFLDHDDVLAPDALLAVADALTRHLHARLLYSDEDKLDENGERAEPHFKSSWNPDLLTSQNYIGHLLVIERALVDRVGRMRPGFEGGQDFDLILRCVERLCATEIVHIPAILYHWRKTPGSTALNIGEKHYAHEAGVRAVQRALQPDGPNGAR